MVTEVIFVHGSPVKENSPLLELEARLITVAVVTLNGFSSWDWTVITSGTGPGFNGPGWGNEGQGIDRRIPDCKGTGGNGERHRPGGVVRGMVA